MPKVLRSSIIKNPYEIFTQVTKFSDNNKDKILWKKKKTETQTPPGNTTLSFPGRGGNSVPKSFTFTDFQINSVLNILDQLLTSTSLLIHEALEV